ncbi:redoxin domain-containing protein [Planctomicrobium sp. SH668]|uniref:redoxin domain-containing protein n=1 Tax=Planctomicrobium sp. SH668 TaxID=3448126 RepID=UPI003F5B1C79
MKLIQLTTSLIVCLLCFTASAQDVVSFETPNEFTAVDHRGKEVSLSDFKDSKCVVIAFLGTECPLAKMYTARLNALAQEFPSEQLQVIGINSNAQDSLSEISHYIQHHRVTFPILKDAGNKIADQLKAERTPQVFLLDQHRQIRYQGRVDDQYLIGIVRKAPQREDLKIAIQELLEDKPVSIAFTTPIGCLIGRIKAADESSDITFSNQIVRIFNANCVQCHRAGDAAPFSLTSYDDIAGWGPMIAEVVKEGRMPPWHADPNHGEFQNENRLSSEQREMIAKWVENGCPLGDPADLPPPVEFVDGWQLPREPDLVVKMAETPYQVPADGGDEGIKYQHFWVDPQLTEEKWINAAEILPGNRAIVHHVIVYASPEKGKKRNESFIAAYVPGLRINLPPKGAAKRLPAGTWLRFEVHYTPNGMATEDLTSIGFLFADPNDVTHEIQTTVAGNQEFVIQPQLADQRFHASSGKSPTDVHLLSMSPHMHLRGQKFEYEVEYPDGTREVLLKVPNYDFNWQTQYRLAEPKLIPAGSIIHCMAAFDNSPQNAANPNPDATVVWGDQSWEEMFLGYMDIMYPVPNKQGNEKSSAKLEASLKKISPEDAFKVLDANKDGLVTPEEAAVLGFDRTKFDLGDENGDGKVTLEELIRVLENSKKKK